MTFCGTVSRSTIELQMDLLVIEVAAKYDPELGPQKTLRKAARACNDMVNRRPVSKKRLRWLEGLMDALSKECLRRTGSPGCGTVRL